MSVDLAVDRRVMMNRNGIPLVLLITVALLAGCDSDAKKTARAFAGGDPDSGKNAISNYGCASCHTIPGIRGADALVGPPLDHMAGRNYVGGVARNNPRNMISWIQNPKQIDAKAAMPNLFIPEPDARDIASYLYTLR